MKHKRQTVSKPGEEDSEKPEGGTTKSSKSDKSSKLAAASPDDKKSCQSCDLMTPSSPESLSISPDSTNSKKVLTTSNNNSPKKSSKVNESTSNNTPTSTAVPSNLKNALSKLPQSIMNGGNMSTENNNSSYYKDNNNSIVGEIGSIVDSCKKELFDSNMMDTSKTNNMKSLEHMKMSHIDLFENKPPLLSEMNSSKNSMILDSGKMAAHPPPSKYKNNMPMGNSKFKRNKQSSNPVNHPINNSLAGINSCYEYPPPGAARYPNSYSSCATNNTRYPMTNNANPSVTPTGTHLPVRAVGNTSTKDSSRYGSNPTGYSSVTCYNNPATYPHVPEGTHGYGTGYANSSHSSCSYEYASSSNISQNSANPDVIMASATNMNSPAPSGGQYGQQPISYSSNGGNSSYYNSSSTGYPYNGSGQQSAPGYQQGGGSPYGNSYGDVYGQQQYDPSMSYQYNEEQYNVGSSSGSSSMGYHSGGSSGGSSSVDGSAPIGTDGNYGSSHHGYGAYFDQCGNSNAMGSESSAVSTVGGSNSNVNPSSSEFSFLTNLTNDYNNPGEYYQLS